MTGSGYAVPVRPILKAGDVMRKAEIEKTLREFGYIDAWKQEGWQEGLEEEKRRTARAMLAKEMDINTIAQITGLTVKQISQL